MNSLEDWTYFLLPSIKCLWRYDDTSKQYQIKNLLNEKWENVDNENEELMRLIYMESVIVEKEDIKMLHEQCKSHLEHLSKENNTSTKESWKFFEQFVK